MTSRVRFLLADSDERSSIGTRLRRRRLEALGRRFPSLEEMRIVDLGGTVRHWEVAPVRPRSVVIVNLLPEVSHHDWITAIEGDACSCREQLHGQEFDLVRLPVSHVRPRQDGPNSERGNGGPARPLPSRSSGARKR